MSEPVVLPQGTIEMVFTVKDTRSDCNTHTESRVFQVEPPRAKDTAKMMKKEALDDLKTGDVTQGLQTLGVLSAVVFAPPAPPPPARGGNATNSTANNGGAPVEPVTLAPKTAEDEQKEMEQRDLLVDIVSSILENNVENITGDQADLIVSTMTLVSGGAEPAVMSTATCEKAADTLLTLSGTGKVSANKTASFATACVNILSNIGGDTTAEHATDETTADPEQQKAVVEQVAAAVSNVVQSLLPPIVEGEKVNLEPVSAKSPDGTLEAVAKRLACTESVSEIKSGNFTIAFPSTWNDGCAQDGRVRRDGSSGGVMSSLAFANSPFAWANNSAEGAIGGLDLYTDDAGSRRSGRARRGKVSAQNKAECALLSIAYTDQVQYSEYHEIEGSVPLTLSFNRTQGDLSKSLHVIVEPYYSARDQLLGEPTLVDAFLRTTPELTALDIDGINASIFNHSYTPQAVRGAPPANAQALPQTLGDIGHVLHLIPVHHANNTCNDPRSEVTSTFNTNFVTYTLVVRTNATEKVKIHVRVFHAECVFIESGSSAWGTAGCAALPTTTPEALMCGCNHLTSFGGRWSAAPISPNMVEVRLISGNDILDNPVVFVPIALLWVAFVVLLIWAHRAEKHNLLVPQLPHHVDRDDDLSAEKGHLHDLRLTVKTGTRPFAGLTSKNKLIVTLVSSSGKEDEFELGADDASLSLARNTKSVWLFTTPLSLSEVTEITLRVAGVDNDCYVSYCVLSDRAEAETAFQLLNESQMDPFEVDRRSTFFWFNEWVNIYKESVAESMSYEDFNSPSHLFAFHVSEKLADKHFILSMFLFPPKSKFTPAQRVGVCFLLLFGIVFANAFFYQGDVELSWESAVFVAAASSVIVTVPVAATIFVLRRTGRGSGSKHMVVRWMVWIIIVGASAWCSYYVLLLSFAWGQDKSWRWLGSVGTSFAISTVVVDLVTVLVVATVAARATKIHDIATVKEVATQNYVTKSAHIKKKEEGKRQRKEKKEKSKKKKEKRQAKQETMGEMERMGEKERGRGALTAESQSSSSYGKSNEDAASVASETAYAEATTSHFVPRSSAFLDVARATTSKAKWRSASKKGRQPSRRGSPVLTHNLPQNYGFHDDELRESQFGDDDSVVEGHAFDDAFGFRDDELAMQFGSGRRGGSGSGSHADWASGADTINNGQHDPNLNVTRGWGDVAPQMVAVASPWSQRQAPHTAANEWTTVHQAVLQESFHAKSNLHSQHSVRHGPALGAQPLPDDEYLQVGQQQQQQFFGQHGW